jgi:hypothetical protein
MFCPSCGKQILERRMFCPHCGKRVPETLYSEVSRQSTSAPIEWEYKEFIYRFPPPDKTIKAFIEGDYAYNELGAKLLFWQEYQDQILPALQKWIDLGWQPVGEVGPAAIKTLQDREISMDFYGWAATIIFLFIPLLWGMGVKSYLQPERLVVKMRGPKGLQVPEEYLLSAQPR